MSNPESTAGSRAFKWERTVEDGWVMPLSAYDDEDEEWDEVYSNVFLWKEERKHNPWNCEMWLVPWDERMEAEEGTANSKSTVFSAKSLKEAKQIAIMLAADWAREHADVYRDVARRAGEIAASLATMAEEEE